jgi:two-component system, NtrC family, response regulator AtoC
MGQEFLKTTEADALRTAVVADEDGFLPTVSPSMMPVEVVVRELAQNEVPVLLLAESGAGKRTLARQIHQASARKADEFRMVLSSELAPEAFDEPGFEALFSSGTVYLEEVSDLGATSQVKLLEALPKTDENKGNKMRARLICGSGRDLETEVRSGRFREDLYYRVSGVCLRVPPLRQRREDVLHLMDFFLSKYARDFRRPKPVLSAQTQQLFLDYAWPGNVRELEDAAKAIVALGDEAVAMGGLRAMLLKAERGGTGGTVSLKQAARAASREAEKELILKVLTRTRWNRRRAAQELQISYKALLYKLKQIGYEEYGAS